MPNLTIKDIARISGCSVSTISRVINDRPDVRPETKEHVLKVMREAGFVPNTNARQLKIQQSRSLVFVVKGTRNLFFSDFLVQLQRAATLYGYNGIVSYLDENANEVDAAEKIWKAHCGFVVNLGGATCADVLALCDEVRAIVKEKTGYDLEKEIRVVR